MCVRYGHGVSWIVPTPATAGKVDFRPRMHVASFWVVTIALVATHKPSPDVENAACVHKQNGQVAAGAAALSQCDPSRLGRTFLANDLCAIFLHLGTENLEKIERASLRHIRNMASKIGNIVVVAFARAIRSDPAFKFLRIAQRQCLRVAPQQIVESIHALSFYFETALDTKVVGKSVEPGVSYAIPLKIDAFGKLDWSRVDLERELKQLQCAIRSRAEPKHVGLKPNYIAVPVRSAVVNSKPHST